MGSFSATFSACFEYKVADVWSVSQTVVHLCGGAILRKVMLEGIEQGIVSLPVHDAIAVKQGDAEWAKEAMSRWWREETLGCKTLLKVDYPD